MNSPNHLTFTQVLSALKRHKLKSIASFLLVMLLVTVAFLLWPRKYGSEGRLFVQLGGNTNASLDPTQGSQSISIQDSRETSVRSVIELVKSRAVLEACVDEIGADEILKGPFDEWIPEIEIPNMPWNESSDEDGMTKEEYKRLKNRERAAKRLEKNMTVDMQKKTSVISIYLKARSPKLAQRIVDTVMKLTREKHLEVHAIKGSSRFFDSEFELHQKRLVEAENAQNEFRNENSFLSINGARSTLQQVIDKLELDKITAQVELDSANEAVAKYTAEISELSNIVDVPKSGVEKLSYEDSRTDVFRLESEKDRLVSLYSPQHPEVQRIEEQLARVKNSLKDMEVERTETESQLNPIYEQVKVNYINSLVRRDEAEAKLNSTIEKYKHTQAKLRETNDASVDAEQLNRNVEIAKQYLDLFIRKRGESRVLDEMKKVALSEVVIAQPANFVVKHISPKGSLMIPLGGLLAFLTSIATALFYERNHLSASLGEEEVEQILDMPVLVTLPRVYSSRNMVN